MNRKYLGEVDSTSLRVSKMKQSTVGAHTRVTVVYSEFTSNWLWLYRLTKVNVYR